MKVVVILSIALCACAHPPLVRLAAHDSAVVLSDHSGGSFAYETREFPAYAAAPWPNVMPHYPLFYATPYFTVPKMEEKVMHKAVVMSEGKTEFIPEVKVDLMETKMDIPEFRTHGMMMKDKVEKDVGFVEKKEVIPRTHHITSYYWSHPVFSVPQTYALLTPTWLPHEVHLKGDESHGLGEDKLKMRLAWKCRMMLEGKEMKEEDKKMIEGKCKMEEEKMMMERKCRMMEWKDEEERMMMEGKCKLMEEDYKMMMNRECREMTEWMSMEERMMMDGKCKMWEEKMMVVEMPMKEDKTKPAMEGQPLEPMILTEEQLPETQPPVEIETPETLPEMLPTEEEAKEPPAPEDILNEPVEVDDTVSIESAVPV